MDSTVLRERLTEFVDADAERREAIVEEVVSENDRVTADAVAFVTDVPENKSNWREAYTALSDRYIKRFIAPPPVSHNPEAAANDGSAVTDSPERIADIFKVKE